MARGPVGLFIHWGIYLVPAGIWKGKPVDGIGEWIMHNGRIPVADYAKFAAEFNPVKFNAEEWVLLAKIPVPSVDRLESLRSVCLFPLMKRYSSLAARRLLMICPQMPWSKDVSSPASLRVFHEANP